MIGGDMICLDVMYLDICLFCGLHHLPVTASCCGVLLSRLVKHSCHCHWNDWHICGVQLCVCTRLNERNWTVSCQLALLCWRSNSCNHEWLLWATVNCVVAVSIITVCTPFNGIIRSSDCRCFCGDDENRASITLCQLRYSTDVDWTVDMCTYCCRCSLREYYSVVIFSSLFIIFEFVQLCVLVCLLCLVYICHFSFQAWCHAKQPNRACLSYIYFVL